MKTLPFFLLTLVVGCDDNSAELSKLNSEIKVLSDRTEEYENQIKEIEVEASDEKVRFDKEKIELVSKIKNLESKLKEVQKDKIDGESSIEQSLKERDLRIVALEEEKIKMKQRHEEFLDTLRKEQKVQLRNLQKEIRKAEADGYKRGIDEMLYRMNKSKGL